MLSWSHHPESPPCPVSGCYRNQLRSIDPQNLEQTEAGNQTHCHGASGRSDFGYSGTIWQLTHQTAGGFVVNLGCTAEVSTALCRGCQLGVGRAGYISISLESWDPTTSHGWFYTPSACPACLSTSFESFPQEILSNLQFWWVLGFLCSLLMHGLFSPPHDQHGPWELTSHFCQCNFSWSISDFPSLSENKQRQKHLSATWRFISQFLKIF